jgi:hypothetical protein
MLFNFLKLFRLDVSAMMDSVKAGLDLRFEQAKDGFSQMAVQVAVITTLLVFAAIAGAGAFGVALLALYQWTAEEAGVYAGLGAVGTALIVAATILAIAATMRSRSFARIEKQSDATPTKAVTFDAGSVAAATDGDANESGSALHSSAFATLAPSKATTSDLVEPMAFFLAKIMKFPRAEKRIVDVLVGDLRETARGTADEAIARAADVIRKGDRIHLVVVLSGAAFIGWLLAHQSQR